MLIRPGLAVGILAVVVGCSQTPSSSSVRSAAESPPPSATTGQAPESSVAPAPSANPDERHELSPDSLADVVTTDLAMRSLPGVTNDSVILDRILQPDDRLFVIDGPVQATDYEWYQVEVLEGLDRGQVGWVAASSREGEAWIAPATIDCPDPEAADAFELDTFHRLELLSCLGDRQIEVTVQALGICSGYIEGEPNFTFEPTWIGMHSTCGWGREGTFLTTMQPFLAPSVGGGFPAGAEYLDWYRLAGQFDHPDARSCVLRELNGDPNMPPMPDLPSAQVVLICRSHFAVERAERLAEP